MRPVTVAEMRRVVAKIPTASRTIPAVTTQRGPYLRANVAAQRSGEKGPDRERQEDEPGLERRVAEHGLEEERQREQQPELPQRDDRARQVAVTGSPDSATA